MAQFVLRATIQRGEGRRGSSTRDRMLRAQDFQRGRRADASITLFARSGGRSLHAKQHQLLLVHRGVIGGVDPVGGERDYFWCRDSPKSAKKLGIVADSKVVDGEGSRLARERPGFGFVLSPTDNYARGSRVLEDALVGSRQVQQRV